MKGYKDLTTGSPFKNILFFCIPIFIGNIFQQLYSMVDTIIVGQTISLDALAAVGSSYTLMTFLTSVLLGLCMGSGAVFSIQFGRHDTERLKHSVSLSFLLIAAVTFLLNAGALCGLNGIIRLLRVPAQVTGLMKGYLKIIFWGIGATFCYNFFACLLRSIGNSTIPLLFLGGAAILNIALDLLFVLQFHWGVRGAAAATVIAQALSGAGLAVYTLTAFPQLRVSKRHLKWDRVILRDIASLSLLTCVQQSIMNFGILMVQGLVNSFGPVIMAAFAAAVKIDSFAYMPVQDFGNAFSTFIAQNYGAGEKERIRKGIRSAAACSMVFCLAVSAAVCLLARPLMGLFVSPAETQIIAAGMRYLRIEASFYCGIGLLFLLYGFYRAIQKPGVSVVLTVISLGTRVALAYALSAIPSIGVTGIWVSVPIGWLLADLAGILFYPFLSRRARKNASPALYR